MNSLNKDKFFRNGFVSFEDIACLGDSSSLSEISLDGNPITQEQYYKQIVLRHMQQLKQLDMKRVTEEERRIALEKKRLAINNAKRQWELMQGSMMGQTGKLVKMPELYANHVGTVPNSEIVTPLYDGDEIIEGDSRTGDIGNLADLEGDTLTLYGNQSLEALERNWGMQAAGAVSKVIFKFIDFDEIAKHLHKIRTRFPGVQSLVFTATNIKSLHQINALSNVRRIDNLTINPEGNPITKFTLWRMYLLFRLAHFALKKINDVEITAGDIVNAEKLFGPISHITTSQMPQSRLLSLLGETRRKQLLAMSDEKSKKVLEGKLDKSQGEFVGRSGLTYQTPDSLSSKQQQDLVNLPQIVQFKYMYNI
ncbi:hypothetical protein KUTeg_011517 [Tegillarca granosa]|uniref:Uncharacterized protein n=1 Tax=Tegillarca granosa TaxID=220873 RepID=A0ABQ9F4V4_TEGGR|nr:hypothetical protein KUTeg_011517 [Tegillarca granosa]